MTVGLLSRIRATYSPPSLLNTARISLFSSLTKAFWSSNSHLRPFSQKLADAEKGPADVGHLECAFQKPGRWTIGKGREIQLDLAPVGDTLTISHNEFLASTAP